MRTFIDFTSPKNVACHNVLQQKVIFSNLHNIFRQHRTCKSLKILLNYSAFHSDCLRNISNEIIYEWQIAINSANTPNESENGVDWKM